MAAGSEVPQPTGTARRGLPPSDALVWLERRQAAPRGGALRRFYGLARGASSGSGPGLIQRPLGPAQSRTAEWGNPVTAAISFAVCPARAADRTASTRPVRACSCSAARWRHRSSSKHPRLRFSPMWRSMARSSASAGAARPSGYRALSDDRARPGTPAGGAGQPAMPRGSGFDAHETGAAGLASAVGASEPTPQTTIRQSYALVPLYPLAKPPLTLSRRQACLERDGGYFILPIEQG